MMSAETLLIIGAGIEAIPGIRKAREMGLYVVASDGNPLAPGLEFADERILASTYDVQATVQAALNFHKRRRPLNGVMCIATDVPHTVANVAHALQLPGIPLDAANLAIDKLAMKCRFKRDDIPIPFFTQIDSFEHLSRVVSKASFPLVLKPVDSRGARGVLRLSKATDLDWAFQTARSHSPTGRVMAEEYLAGPQISTETIVLNGTAYTPGFSDRNYEYLDIYAPYIIENGGQLPSKHPTEVQDAVRRLVQDAALSMGVCHGVVKGDIVVSRGRPYIIELAARLSGGYFCTHTLPLNTGVDFLCLAIKLALGHHLNPAELSPRYQRGVAQRYLFPTPGRVTHISGVDAAQRSPGIVFCEIRVRVGDTVAPIDSHPARAGVLIAVGESQQHAIERASEAVRRIRIDTQPLN